MRECVGMGIGGRGVSLCPDGNGDIELDRILCACSSVDGGSTLESADCLDSGSPGVGRGWEHGAAASWGSCSPSGCTVETVSGMRSSAIASIEEGGTWEGSLRLGSGRIGMREDGAVLDEVISAGGGG